MRATLSGGGVADGAHDILSVLGQASVFTLPLLRIHLDSVKRCAVNKISCHQYTLQVTPNYTKRMLLTANFVFTLKPVLLPTLRSHCLF